MLDQGKWVKPPFRYEYAQRTADIVAYCKKIDRLLKGDGGLIQQVSAELREHALDIPPVNGKTDLVERILEINQGVAEATKIAAGHSFDTVINPYSGAEIMSAVPFADRIYTIDRDSIFDYMPKRRDETLVSLLKTQLEAKLTKNFYLSGASNYGLLTYALELSLLGVSMDSLHIVEERQIDDALVVTVAFDLPQKDGTTSKIIHTHIATTIPDTLSDNTAIQRYLLKAIEAEKEQENNILFLSKAGLSRALRPFASHLPKGSAILIEDTQEAEKQSPPGMLEKRTIDVPSVLHMSEYISEDGRRQTRAEDLYAARYGYGSVADLEVYTVAKE